MIPHNQQDYFKYQAALKGNVRKGADLLSALLADPGTAPEITSSGTAASVICNNALAPRNRPLLETVGSSEYANELLLTYANTLLGTSYEEFKQVYQDEHREKFFSSPAALIPYLTDYSGGLDIDLQYNGLVSSYTPGIGYVDGDMSESTLPYKMYGLTVPAENPFIRYFAYVPTVKCWYGCDVGYPKGQNSGNKYPTIWRITDNNKCEVVYQRTDVSNAYEKMEFCAHDGKLYLYRYNYFDIFNVNEKGIPEFERSINCGAGLQINIVKYDTARECICVEGNMSKGSGNSFMGNTNPLTEANAFVAMIAPKGWETEDQFLGSFTWIGLFEKDPVSGATPNVTTFRCASLDPLTGDWIFFVYYGFFVFRADNTAVKFCTYFRPDKSSYDYESTDGYTAENMGKRKWFVWSNYIKRIGNSSSSYGSVDILTLTEDYSSFKIDTINQHSMISASADYCTGLLIFPRLKAAAVMERSLVSNPHWQKYYVYDLEQMKWKTITQQKSVITGAPYNAPITSIYTNETIIPYSEDSLTPSTNYSHMPMICRKVR